MLINDHDNFNPTSVDSFDRPTDDYPASSAHQGRPTDDGGWLASLPDDLHRTAEDKGWRSPAEALREYRRLEEFMGREQTERGLALPRDENDAEGFERLYRALGRPDQADGYELSGLFGGQELDQGVMSAMSQAMHEAGLSKKQAQKLASAYQSLWLHGMEDEARRYEAEVSEARDRLPAATQEMARRGFRMLRLPPDEARTVSENLERALGPRAAVELFARLGSSLAEDRPVSGSGNGFEGGPDSATRRLDRLLADPDFSRRYLGGDQRAIDEISELSRRAALK